jgi:post-segregation antitoxin (ccd killing protein)
MPNYTEELKNGIFHLSVSMCQYLSQFMAMEIAKEQTALWLEEIAAGLRKVKKNPLEDIINND